MTRLTTERARLFADRPYVPCCDDRECVERQAERDVHDLAREVLALTSERDAAQHAADALRTALDGLRAAVATVRDARAVVAATGAASIAAWDAVEALPTASQTEGIAVALRASYEAGDALNAALRSLRDHIAAEPERVAAAVAAETARCVALCRARAENRRKEAEDETAAAEYVEALESLSHAREADALADAIARRSC